MRSAERVGKCLLLGADRTYDHGIGFNTAAIELLLPTYGEKLGGEADCYDDDVLKY
jgi:hypothetical protein